VSYPYIDNIHLPADIKEKFDYIHLFLHYRMNGPRFAQYIDMAKALFPNAKIIAGFMRMIGLIISHAARMTAPNAPALNKKNLLFLTKRLDCRSNFSRKEK